jgi:hypothetical protein
MRAFRPEMVFTKESAYDRGFDISNPSRTTHEENFLFLCSLLFHVAAKAAGPSWEAL